jgi:hypothetical protein
MPTVAQHLLQTPVDGSLAAGAVPQIAVCDPWQVCGGYQHMVNLFRSSAPMRYRGCVAEKHIAVDRRHQRRSGSGNPR